MECGNTRNDHFNESSWENSLELKKYYAEKIGKTTGKEIQIQHWSVNSQLSMEGIAVEYFPN